MPGLLSFLMSLSRASCGVLSVCPASSLSIVICPESILWKDNSVLSTVDRAREGWWLLFCNIDKPLTSWLTSHITPLSLSKGDILTRWRLMTFLSLVAGQQFTPPPLTQISCISSNQNNSVKRLIRDPIFPPLIDCVLLQAGLQQSQREDQVSHPHREKQGQEQQTSRNRIEQLNKFKSLKTKESL